MASDLETKKNLLYACAMKGKWDKVITLYAEDPRLHKAKITTSGSTALHVAVFDGNEEVVEKMVELSGRCTQHCKEALETQDRRKNTALHVAASTGNLRMCHLIAQRHPDLVSVRNVDGETPLFLAALHGRKEAFLCLHHLSHCNGSCSNPRPNYENCRRNSGDTILHCAIAGSFYDLAFQIIRLYEELVNWVNEEGLSPLHLLAAKPSDFRSGSRLGRYERIIYHCMYVEELKVAKYHHQESFSEAGQHKNLPANYRTCCDIFRVVKTSLLVALHFLKKNFFSKGEPSNATDPEVARNNNIPGSDFKAPGHPRHLYPENYKPSRKFSRFVYLALTVVLGEGPSVFKGIRQKKEKHVWSLQIMNELLHRTCLFYEDDGRKPQDVDYGSYTYHAEDKTLHPFYLHQRWDKGGEYSKKKRTETVILMAAKSGVAEMVEKIIELFPMAIDEKNEEKKNVVLLAVEHKEHQVCQLLRQQNILKESAFRQVDHEGNNILHLAAKFGQYKPWFIPGPALQMQWEIKWFEYVKSFVPYHFTFLKNRDGETPGEIFLKHHKDLVDKSDEWLSRTSESCSVVAALVAGVSFATSTTLPGGNDDKTGKPTLEGHAGFDIFAIAALTALCFSVTALILFLSTLISRKQPSDFVKNLPVKLFLALSSLFVSIVSMFISFCAAHSFVLKDKFKKSVIPLYVIMCLPVCFTIIEFPIYLDLLEGILVEVSRP